MRHKEHELSREAPEELAMGCAATAGLPIACSSGRANVCHQLDKAPGGDCEHPIPGHQDVQKLYS